MPAYVIFDVEIHDPVQFQEFMTGVKPAIEAAGAKYLARGGAHKIHEGDRSPRHTYRWSSRRWRQGRHSTMTRPIKA